MDCGQGLGSCGELKVRWSIIGEVFAGVVLVFIGGPMFFLVGLGWFIFPIPIPFLGNQLFIVVGLALMIDGIQRLWRS